MILILGIAIGCSSSKSLGPVTSLQGDASVQSLSTDDLGRLCADVASYAAKVLGGPVVCRPSGASAALSISTKLGATDPDVQRECVLAYAACINETAMNTADGGTELGPCFAQDPPCPLAIDEVSACVREQATAALQAYQAYPLCHQITIAWLQSASEGTGASDAVPASCTNLAQQCAAVYNALLTVSGLGLPTPFLPQ